VPSRVPPSREIRYVRFPFVVDRTSTPVGPARRPWRRWPCPRRGRHPTSASRPAGCGEPPRWQPCGLVGVQRRVVVLEHLEQSHNGVGIRSDLVRHHSRRRGRRRRGDREPTPPHRLGQGGVDDHVCATHGRCAERLPVSAALLALVGVEAVQVGSRELPQWAVAEQWLDAHVDLAAVITPGPATSPAQRGGTTGPAARRRCQPQRRGGPSPPR
jgi:hypothetical protein